MLKACYTAEALEDLDKVGIWGVRKFGIEAVDRYAHLIDFSVEKLRENPQTVGVRPTLKGLFKFHLSTCKDEVPFAGKTVKKPRHLIFFRIVGNEMLEVVRILRDDMDFETHL